MEPHSVGHRDTERGRRLHYRGDEVTLEGREFGPPPDLGPGRCLQKDDKGPQTGLLQAGASTQTDVWARGWTAWAGVHPG